MLKGVTCSILLLALPIALAVGQLPGSPGGEGIEWISVSPRGAYVAAYICRPAAFPARLLVLDSSGQKVCEVHLTRLEQMAGHDVRPLAWAPDESVLFIASGGDRDTEGELLTLSLPDGGIEKAADLPSALDFSGLHVLSSEAVLFTLAANADRETPAGLYLLEKRNGKWRTDAVWTGEYMDVRCLWSRPDGDGYRLLLANLTHGGATNLIALLTARLHGSQLSERKEVLVQMVPARRVAGASPEGEWVAVLTAARAKLLLYRAEGQWETTAVSLPLVESLMAFSPDGKKLAFWFNQPGDDGQGEQFTQRILIMDTSTLRITELPNLRVASVAWLSPKELLVGTYSQIVKWDIQSGNVAEFLPTLPPPEATAAQAVGHSSLAGPSPDRGPALKPLRGGFGPPHLVTRRIRGHTGLCAADLDGDGNADLLSASDLDGKVAWYKNTGGGNFSEQRPITGGLLPRSISAPACVRAADLDGDGDTDVLVASGRSEDSGQGGVWWFENLGGGRLSSKRAIVRGIDWARDVDAADLDGDGDGDVLFASVGQSKIAWCENLGGGRFNSPVALSTQANQAASVSTADLDGDGDRDVLSGSFLEVSWYENLGAGRFGPPKSVTRRVKWATGVQGADMDSDGAPDVLVSQIWPEGPVVSVAWYQNIGGGRFGPERIISDRAASFSVADLDGDGDLDVISTTGAGLGWFENVRGSLGPIRVIASDFPVRGVCATDVDGDGDPDVVTAVGEDERIVWYENRISTGPSG